MNFSYCLFFLVVAVLASGDATLSDPMKYQRDKCMNASGVTQSDLVKAEVSLSSNTAIVDIIASMSSKVINYIVLLITELGCYKDRKIDVELLVEVFQWGCPRILSSQIFIYAGALIYGGKAPASNKVSESILRVIYEIIQRLPKPIWDLMGFFKPPVMPSNLPSNLLTCTVNLPLGIIGSL